MPRDQNQKLLVDLLSSKTAVDLPAIQSALGGVSVMTVFRYLRQVPYRRSYNHNGRFYALDDASRYDKSGLWTWGDIHFSTDGSLKSTVRRIVREEEAGATHRELHELLRVRVHNTLLDLLRQGDVGRERIMDAYVYVHSDPSVRQDQIERRRDLIAKAEAAAAGTVGVAELSDHVVIQVLLVLVRHPGASPADVVRHLQGQAPPVAYEQVCAVFARHDIGGKKRPWKC